MNKDRQCNFIKEDGKRCGMYRFHNGFCIHHSKSKEARAEKARMAELRKKARKLSVATGKKLKIKNPHPLKQIRKFCLECHGGYKDSVKFCMAVECPLWFLRFGSAPKTVITNNNQEQMLLDPNAFGADKFFDSEDYVHEQRKKWETLISGELPKKSQKRNLSWK